MRNMERTILTFVLKWISFLSFFFFFFFNEKSYLSDPFVDESKILKQKQNKNSPRFYSGNISFIFMIRLDIYIVYIYIVYIYIYDIVFVNYRQNFQNLSINFITYCIISKLYIYYLIFLLKFKLMRYIFISFLCNLC